MESINRLASIGGIVYVYHIATLLILLVDALPTITILYRAGIKIIGSHSSSR